MITKAHMPTKGILNVIAARILIALMALVAMVGTGASALAQTTFQYKYDASGQLVSATDSTGVVVVYAYDAAGNITGVTRQTAGSTISFAPSSGGPGTTVNIQGAGFSTTVANNSVKFNGAAAVVNSATATSLTVTVPAGATTGIVTVTVGTATFSSATGFTVVASPLLSSMSLKYALTGASTGTLVVNGSNFTGSTFSFTPVVNPAAITISNAAISGGGATATLTFTTAVGNGGPFVLVATNGAGSSSAFSSAANTLTILQPGLDNDNDGLTNAQELALGTDPLNPDTDGDGMPDGWEVKYGLNPLSAADAAVDTDNDGLTNLQEYNLGTDPTNPDVVAPTVSSFVPAAGTNTLPINGSIVAVMNKSLLSQLQINTLGKLNPNVTGGGFVVKQGNATVPGVTSLSADGKTLSFTPTLGLTASTAYSATLTGFRSAAGVPLAAPFTIAFSTNANADLTAPTVVSENPSPNATGVPINTSMSVYFSKRIDGGSLSTNSFVVMDQTANVRIPGVVTLDGSGRVATFKPTNNLPVGRQFYFQLNTYATIKDTAGNALLGQPYWYFYSGFAADTTPPAITGNSPQDGDTGITVNTKITINFSKPINQITAVSGVQVKLNGNPVSGSWSFLSNATQMLFTPDNPFLPGLHTVSTTPLLTDLAGNPITNTVTFSFTVDTAADTGTGSVISANPPNGYTGIGRNAFVTLKLNKRVNPLSVNSTSFYFLDDNTQKQFPATFVVSADRLTATLTPSSLLAANERYCFAWSYYASLVDLSGNNFNYFRWCFTTGATTDNVAPTVTSVNPPAGSTGVPLNAVIVAQVSEPLNSLTFSQSSFTLATGGAKVDGTASLSSDLLTINFVPTLPLAAGKVYQATISGVTDIVGNPLTTYTSIFTTGTTADSTQPFIISATPASAGTGVGTTANVSVTFSKFMNPLTVNTTTFRVYQQTTGINMAGTLVLTNSGPGGQVVFTPGSPYPSGSVICYTLNQVQDFAGNNNQYLNNCFTTAGTADTVAPTVTSVTPTDGSTALGLSTSVTLTFSKPLNPATLGQTTFALYIGTARQGISISNSADYKSVSLSTGLAANTTYTVIATNGVQDLSGNSLADFRSSFTTVTAPDSNRPSITGIRPGNGATVVPVGAQIVMYANKQIDGATIQGGVHISQNGFLLSGTTSLTGTGQTIVFVPSVPFAAGAYIQIFADSTVLDVSGNALYNYQAAFSTTPDLTTTAPTIISTIPASCQGSCTTSTNPIIDIQFSKPIDPATVNTTNFTLKFQQNSQAVSATVTQISPTVVRMVPTSLFPNFNYYYSITTAVQDTTALALNGNYNYYFTTGANPDTAQPRVSAVTPPGGSQNIGVNAPVYLRFTKAIDQISANTTNIVLTANGNPVTPVSISFPDSQTVLLTPVGTLPDAATVSITVNNVVDGSGNLVIPYTSSFTTRTGPNLLNVSVIQSNPFNGATNVPTNTAFTMVFDEPIDPLTLTSSGLALYDTITGGYIPGTYSLSPDAQTASFVPTSALAVGRQYYMYYNSYIRDLVGNLLNGGSIQFTTAFAPSSTPPTVTSFNPESTPAGAPINSTIQVLFSSPVSALTLKQITLQADGVTVTNVLPQLSAGNTLLTLIPPALMKGGTPYTVNLVGIQDVSGNALTPSVVKSFATAPGADLTGSGAVGYNPPYSSRVGTNIAPTFYFSKRVNPVSVATASLYITDNTTGQSVPITITISTDRLTVQLTPKTTLKGNTQYCAYAYGVTDVIGNMWNSGFCFFTNLSNDTAAPYVTSTNPPASAVVPINTSPSFLLSKPLNPTTVNQTAVVLKAGNTVVAGIVSLAGDGVTLTFTPKAPLLSNTAYTATATGFTDYVGNPVTPFSLSFTTDNTGSNDTVAPIILSNTPVNGAIGVAANTPVVLTFSKPINPITVNRDSFRVYLQASNTYFAGNYVVQGAKVTFVPTSLIPANAVIQVAVSNVFDYAGNTNQYGAFSYTTAGTGDTAAPTVTSITPNTNATNVGVNTSVTITFSKSMNPGTLASNNLGVFSGSSRLNYSGPYISSDNTSARLDMNLPAASTITVTASSAITDLSGNALANYTSSFQTVPVADSSRPSVSAIRPGSGATGVPIASPISLFINKALDPSTITTSSVLVSQNGTLVTGSVLASAGNSVITFTPASSFQKGTRIQVFLLTTILDTFGNALNGYSASFSTEADLSTTNPTYVNYTTVQNANNVPVNAVLEVTFNKPLDPVTITSANAGLKFSANSQAVAATVSLRGDRTIRFVPTSNLLAQFGYYYQVSTGVKDTDGRSVQGLLQFYFTTNNAAPDLTQPRVDVVAPPTTTEVGTNAAVYLHFTKPVSALTFNPSSVTLSYQSGGNTVSIPGSLSYSQGTLTPDVTFTPYGVLPDAAVVTVNALASIQDQSNNGLVPFSSTFTTKAAADITSSSFLSVSPADGTTNVPINSVFTLIGPRPIDPNSVGSAGASLYNNVSGVYVAATLSLSTDLKTLTLTPNAALTASTSYRFYWNSNLRDVTGYYINGGSAGFTTGAASDTTAPTVSLVVPGDGFTAVPTNIVPQVQFNKPINATTVKNVTLTTGSTTLQTTLNLSGANTILSIVPPSILAANTVYKVTVQGVKDISGNAYGSATVTSFTTAAGPDLTSDGAVTGYTPTNAATGVSVSTVATATFNKPVNPLNLGTVYIYENATSAIVAGTITFSTDYKTLTFTPNAALKASTRYQWYFGNGYDLAGNYVGGNGNPYFTTAP